MTDHEVIGLLVGVLAVLAIGTGYALGGLRRHRDETTTSTHQLEERVQANEKRIRAQGALIDVIAEDYDPPPETQEQRKRGALPEGWKVYQGGGSAVVPVVVIGAWIRRHWRKISAASVAAAVGTAVALAVLAHGAPPGHPFAVPPPSSAHPASASASTSRPAPTTKPGHTPGRTLAPTPVPPIRRRQPSPIPTAARSSPPPPPRPTPSPARSSSRPPPKPTPKPTCPVGVAVHLGAIGVTICI